MWHLLSPLFQLLLWHMEPLLCCVTCERPDIWNPFHPLSFPYIPPSITSPFFSPILHCSSQLHHQPLTCMWWCLSSNHKFSSVFFASPSLFPALIFYQLINCHPLLSLFSPSSYVQSNLLLWHRCWKSLFCLYITLHRLFFSNQWSYLLFVSFPLILYTPIIPTVLPPLLWLGVKLLFLNVRG